jgi:hypothetical protein
MDLAVAHTTYASNHVDVTLLPQLVYLRTRNVSTAPTFGRPYQRNSHQLQDGSDEAADIGNNQSITYDMSSATDISRVIENLRTLQRGQQDTLGLQRQQRRAQTSYAQSNTMPLKDGEPVKHIGSMRTLANPVQELPLIGGSRVLVCRGNGLPTADRFPISHASVSRQHAVVDVGADGICRYLNVYQ